MIMLLNCFETLHIIRTIAFVRMKKLEYFTICESYHFHYQLACYYIPTIVQP